MSATASAEGPNRSSDEQMRSVRCLFPVPLLQARCVRQSVPYAEWGDRVMSFRGDRRQTDMTIATDQAAFTELLQRHRRELHVHCYRMLGSFDDCEDLVQETFLRA
jgi:hypothetical protein